MIIKINKKNRNYNLYKCDMCGKIITNGNRNTIFTKDYRQHKLFDLCPNCYRILVKSIKNYKNKKIKEGK